MELYWKRVELKNFQKHGHLVAEPGPGLTVVHGAGRAGKSCLLRAMQWVLTNEPEGDCIRKTDTDLTEVTLTRSDDLVVTRRKGDETMITPVELKDGSIKERSRKQSVNAYILSHPQWDQAKEFHTIGKTIPQEVADLLGLHPLQIEGESVFLNFAPQVTVPFPFDKTPSLVMKIFSTLAQTDVLGKIFKDLNSEILSMGKSEKALTAEVETKTAEAQTLQSTVSSQRKKCTALAEVIEQLAIRQSKLDNLTHLKSEYDRTQAAVVAARESIKPVPDTACLQELRKKAQQLQILQDLAEKYRVAEAEYVASVGILKKTGVLPTGLLRDLKGKADKFNKLLQLNNDYVKLTLEVSEARQQVVNLTQKVQELNTKRVETLKKCPALQCPECGTEIDYDLIKKVVS